MAIERTEHFQILLVVAPEKGGAFSGMPTISFQKAKDLLPKGKQVFCAVEEMVEVPGIEPGSFSV